MKTEELIYSYITKATNKLLGNVIKPDEKYEDVKQIDFEELKRLRDKYDLKGIILDIDGTLRQNMEKIDYRNIRWIIKLKQILKVCMVSNGKDSRVEELAKRMDITYIPLAFKPLKRGFLEAVKDMDVNPTKVLVIGDEYLADILGGKRMGMKTAIISEKKKKKEEREEKEEER